MLIEQIAKHIDRSCTTVNIPAFDRMTVTIRGRGDMSIMDLGYNVSPSHIFAFAISLTESELMGRVYLPLWYTPKMYAAYINALVECALHYRLHESDKLQDMLDGYNPQEARHAALERLADMSYIDGYSVRYCREPRHNLIWQDASNENGEIVYITPEEDYYLRVNVTDAYGMRIADSWRMDYAYDLDDIVAYMTVCKSILQVRQHIVMA